MLCYHIFLFPDFKTFGKPKDFDRINKFFKTFSIAYYFYHITVISLIALSNPIQINKCRKENEKRGIDEICGMTGRMWLPFNYDYFPLKQIIFAYQVSL